MKKSNSKQKAQGAFKKLGVVALITATMFFTACNQAGGGGGEKPKPTPPTPPAKYTVTLTQPVNGKVTTSPAIPTDKQVAKDTIITFTAEANAGYKIGKWTVTPKTALQAGTGADGSSTAKVKITANTTVSVSFEAIPKHAITFSVDGANGTLTAKVDGGEITSGKEVEEGKTVTFTATANDGYRVKGWTLDGSAVNGTNNSYSFPVTKACTVKVSFEDNSTPLPKHKIAFSVDGANGTLKAKADGIDETSTSPITVEEGKTVTFTAEPSTNYKVKEWKVGDTVVTGNKTNTYAHTVTEAVTVKVSFEANSNPPNPPTPTPTKYTVTLNKTEHGKVTASPEIPEDKKVLKDTEITFTAKADDGYKIGKWTVTGSVLETGTGADGNSTAKVKITADTTVSVSFEAIPLTKYTVTLNQTEHGKVTASPEIPEDKKVAKDTEITFTATADSGYRVNTWSVSPSSAIKSGGGKGETTATLKITANTTVSVSFEAIPPTKHAITFSVEGANGTLKAIVSDKEINSGDKVEQGKTVTFTAKADIGYVVKKWTLDGNAVNGTEKTYTLTVTQACKVTVSFELGKAILTLDPNKLNIKVKAKTKDGSAIEVEGCNEPTLASDVETELHATGTTVTLKGYITELYCIGINKGYFVFEAQLVALDVQGLTALQKLNCMGNNLPALNVQGLTTLQVLECYGNQLTELNVQGLTSLQTLYCSSNKIPELNVQGLNALQGLYCDRNKLTRLDVSGLTALQGLGCSDNKLTELNVQGLTSLRSLSCYNNQLTSLNVQGCTALQNLACFNNKLPALNVQGLTSLQVLNCSQSQLTSLDVSDCIALRYLECFSNRLGSKALTKLLDALPDRVVGDRAEARLYCESGCFGSSEGNWKDFTKPKGLKAALDGAKKRNWKLGKINESGIWKDI